MVGQTEDLVHLMRRVDDGHAAGLEAGDGTEQRGDLMVGEGGRRFVHEDHVGLSSERLGDLDDLRLGHRERAHQARRLQVGLEFAEQLTGPGELGGAVDTTETSAGFGAEGDVLRDGQVGDRHQFLVDHRDARDQGVVRRGEVRAGATPFDVAAVRTIEPGEHLHQRRLAGAVLAHERVHLAGAEVDRRRLQHGESAEVLAQFEGSEHRRTKGALSAGAGRGRRRPARRSADGSRGGGIGIPRLRTGSAACRTSAGSRRSSPSRGSGNSGSR